MAAAGTGDFNPDAPAQYDPNCPVFASMMANPLTPAKLVPATYQFTPAVLTSQAKWTSVSATFTGGEITGGHFCSSLFFGGVCSNNRS
jgi:hypothetical protein